jgi:hypothetical protein
MPVSTQTLSQPSAVSSRRRSIRYPVSPNTPLPPATSILTHNHDKHSPFLPWPNALGATRRDRRRDRRLTRVLACGGKIAQALNTMTCPHLSWRKLSHAWTSAEPRRLSSCFWLVPSVWLRRPRLCVWFNAVGVILCCLISGA